MSRGSISHNYEYISTYSNNMQQIISNRLVLKIRQQPVQTRQSTNNERDRRPLDPPPIVQIDLENTSLQETQDFLQNPYLFMCVSLVHPVNHEEIVNSAQNILSGQTASSMYKLKDINNHDGGFFVFGDLSVKLEGQFRLRFSLFEISQTGSSNLKSIYSDVFTVYSSKAFPGMLESTFLSRSFSDQGVRIRIRKEHRVQMSGSRKRKLSLHDDSVDNATEDRFDRNPGQSTMFPSLPYASNPNYVYQQQQQPQNIQLHQLQLHQLQMHQHEQQEQQKKQKHNQIPYSFDSHSQWSHPSDEFPYERRSSVMTAASDTSLNYRRYSFQHNLFGQERRPSIPFSPPHQSYDPSSQRPPVPNDYPSPYFHPGDPNGTRGMIPSPPPSLFKTDHRRLSLDDAPARRQPADLMSYSRRRSLHNHPSRVPSSEVIHLPPIQTIVSPMQKSPRAEDGIGEVDAAVAMMQLASRRQSKNVL